MEYVLPIALVLLAALTKAVMDVSNLGQLPWNPEFWNKNLSWERKWKRDTNGDVIYPLREAFPGSSTVFVFLTDGWHLAQFVFLNSVFLLPFLWQPFFKWWVLDFIALSVVFRVTFELAYRRLKG